MPEPIMPSISFLLDSSKRALQEMEMSALNRSANLGRAAREDLQQWAEQSAVAMLARWMMENREELLKTVVNEKREGFEHLLARRKPPNP